MKHSQKVKIARKISGKQTNHFTSSEWNTRKERIEKRVFLWEKQMQFLANRRKEAKQNVIKTA